MINPPIALYYMQGLNTTANHGHAALFGVYGMLGLGLTLYCLRGLTRVELWNQKLLKVSFWSLNIGLAMMTFLALLPQGIFQAYTSIEQGYSFARSAEFMHSPVMEAMVWARVPGDIVFSIGVFGFVWFVFRALVPKQSADRVAPIGLEPAAAVAPVTEKSGIWKYRAIRKRTFCACPALTDGPAFAALRSMRDIEVLEVQAALPVLCGPSCSISSG